MKPVIAIKDYYQDIYITFGMATEALIKAGKKDQLQMFRRKFKKAESHGQCMDVIFQYVYVLIEDVI